MPSIQSRIVNRLAEASLKRQVSRGFEFDVARIRKLLARVDAMAPAPRDVEIEPVRLSHCDAEWIRPETETDRFVIYLPGGAWVLRCPRMGRRVVARIAKTANANAFLVLYRLAPEHPFPAGLEDCIEAYERLLGMGIDPARIVLGGESAGGNLTLGTLLALRDRGRPLPAGAFSLSGVTDLSFQQDVADFIGRDTEAGRALAKEGDLSAQDPRDLYCGGDRDVLDHPYVSPLRGDLRGLCPLLLQVGSTEPLLKHSTLFAERARAAGVDAEVELWEGQPHGWHGMPFRESEQALGHVSDFVRRCCP